MKFNFKKISAIATSLLLTGMTAGIAAAANYPAPFVSGSTADVAIVYGTGAGVSALDQAQAQNIEVNLGSKITGGVVTIGDGDSYKVEKTTSKLWLGKGLTDVVATALDEDELSVVLAKGTYIDNDNDEFDFKQKIDLSNTTLSLFDDNDYSRDDPTVGLSIADGTNILNYTLDFTTTPLFDDLTNSELTILGKTYYVLSVSGNTTLNLLDSAATTVLGEGETKTVNGKSVSISFIGTSSVKLSVDGVTTNSLAAGETQKLADGSYIGIKEINTQDYAGGIKQVEFSIGTGKLIIENGATVEMNGEDVDGIEATITNVTNTKLDTIVLQWNSDEKTFITETSEAVMPGFNAVKLAYTGMVFPTEEQFILEADGDDSLSLSGFKTVKDDGKINLIYSDGTNFTGLGYDSDNKLATAGTGETLTFTKGTHDYFVLSYMSGDAAESYIVRATSFDDGADSASGTSDDTVKIEYRSGASWIEVDAAAEAADVVEIGSASMTVASVNDSTDVLTATATGSNNFHMLYSTEGLEVFLPLINTTEINITTNATGTCDTINMAAALATIPSPAGLLGYSVVITNNTGVSVTCESLPITYTLLMEEEDKDGAISNGAAFNFSIGYATSGSANVVSVTAVGGETPNSGYEVGQSTREYLSYVNGPLATKILYNSDGTQDYATVTYHGGESYGQLFVAEPGASTSSGSLGNLLVTDSEVSSVSTKNLIIVGGSCINSAAASVLGGAYCGAAFTQATGVGTGEFLIKGVSNSDITSKLALVVAGYEQADTSAATTYLTTQTVDTSKAYKGTSSTSAEVIVA